MGRARALRGRESLETPARPTAHPTTGARACAARGLASNVAERPRQGPCVRLRRRLSGSRGPGVRVGRVAARGSTRPTAPSCNRERLDGPSVDGGRPRRIARRCGWPIPATSTRRNPCASCATSEGAALWHTRTPRHRRNGLFPGPFARSRRTVPVACNVGRFACPELRATRFLQRFAAVAGSRDARGVRSGHCRAFRRRGTVQHPPRWGTSGHVEGVGCHRVRPAAYQKNPSR